MKNIVCLLLICASTALAGVPVVTTGIEVLRGRAFDILQGKRVGLITNPTGVDSRLHSSIDILYNAPGVKLVSLFGPEHGVRGNYSAGDEVGTSVDSVTGLPVYSLYGKTRKPTAAMLKEIDVLVYDIQDIGCRSYTYVSTLGLAMEAAAEARIPFIVLDRPNPLGGVKVEGNIVEAGRESFVSQYAIPYVYGLTCGELAMVLNEEKLLAGAARCSLMVVPMRGWRRSMDFSQTELPWVPTSPHVPEDTSPQYYVASGILGELGVISEGVGYTIPFHIFAAEWIDPNALAAKMEKLNLDGVLFRPVAFKPYYGRSAGKTLHGVQIQICDYTRVNLMSLQFLFMQEHNELYPEKNPFALCDPSRLKTFDNIVGSTRVRELFTKRMRYEDVRDYLEKDVRKFREKSAKHRLYN